MSVYLQFELPSGVHIQQRKSVWIFVYVTVKFALLGCLFNKRWQQIKEQRMKRTLSAGRAKKLL